MYSRKQIDKMSAVQVLILAFLKLYLAACTSGLIMSIIFGLLNILLPLIY